MKIDVIKRKADIKDNQINVIIETSESNPYTDDLTNYIRQFNKNKNGDSKLTVIDGEIVKVIDYQDIICFYSKNKNTYCRTVNTTYRIKSSLYELEKIHNIFVRISKNCIINTNHLKNFGLNTEGKMVVVFDDGTEERVSRRKIKQVGKYLDKRRL